MAKKKKYEEVYEQLIQARNINTSDEVAKAEKYVNENRPGPKTVNFPVKSSTYRKKLEELTKEKALANIALRQGDIAGTNKFKNVTEKYNKEYLPTSQKYNEEKDKEEAEIISKTSEKDLANIDRYNKGANVSDSNIGKVFEYADSVKELRKEGYTIDDIKNIASGRKRQTNATEMAGKEKESAEFAAEHKVLSSILSVPQSVVGGVTGSASAAAQFILDPFRKIDTNEAAFTGSNKARAIRDEVTKDMSPLGRFIYETGMSLTDSLAGGLLGRAAKLGKAGSQVMMGSMSMENTIQDVTERGGTPEQALFSGFANGFFEGFFEEFSLGKLIKLSEGGSKGLKQIAKDIGSSVLVNASEEAATEFSSIMYDTLMNGGISNSVLKIQEYMGQGMTEEEAKATVAREFAIQIGQAGLGGAIAGGALGGAGTVAGRINNRPNDNDNKVIEKETQERAKDKRKTVAIEKEVNKRISESEEVNGVLSDTEKHNIRKAVEADVESGKFDVTATELTTKDFDEIRKQVRDDLENGKISLKRVEETLFPEKAQRFNELIEELKTADEDQRESIESELKNINNDISKIIGSSKHLSKSYEQEMLKNTAFKRETSADDTELTKLLDKSAARAGLNDTPEAHDTYNLLNKVANYSGAEYVFTSNKELEALGYNLKGRTVNGLVRTTKDGKTRVLVNIDSNNALNIIVGHETTHLLENTELYDKLKNLVIDYAKEKGDYDSRLEELTELYKDTNANIEEELVADIIGDYVFTDEAFVKNLSTKQPNIFQKIYNHIKHLVKMATAGSKEAKQLEQIKNTFDKAYKEMGKVSEADSAMTTEADSNVKYSLDDIENMSQKDYNKYGWAKVNDVLSDREFADFMNKVGIKKRQGNHWYLDLQNGKHMFAVGVDGVNSTLVISNGDYLNPSIEKVYYIDLNNETDIEDLRSEIYEREKSGRTLASTITENYFEDEPVELYRLEDFSNYKELRQKYEREQSERNYRNYSELQNGKRSNTKTEIRFDVEEKVPDDGAFFSTTDNQGRELTKKQQEYFKDSKVRDENGNLLTVYHGSKNKFNVFTSDINWFSSSKEYSNNYGKKANLFNEVTKREPKKSKVTFETYLNIKNPKELGDIGGYINQQFDIDELHLPQEDIDNLIKSYKESEGKAPYRVWELVNSKVFKDYLISKGYDGITAKEFGNATYGAFYPEQTKDVDNTNPTSNPDIKYSLSAPVNKIPLEQRVSGDALLDAQDTLDLVRDVGGKADNNGYVTLYHRTSEENAEKIRRTGKMSAKEDGIFFSTSKAGYNEGYGDAVIEFKIPAEELVLDDIFENEAHFRVPLKNRNAVLNVSEYLVDRSEEGYSLSKPGENNIPTDGYAVYGRDVKLQKEIAPIREDIQDLKNTLSDLRENVAALAPEPEGYKASENATKAPIDESVIPYEVSEPVEDIAPVREDLKRKEIKEENNDAKEPEADEAPLITKTRKDLRKALLEDNKDVIMSALENAKNLSSPLMNNTDTIRLSEMVFGRKAGSKINEIIFQRAIDNEAKSVAWQNKERSGIKALGIKPRSKESAAVQKWGEGEYVNEFGDVVEYTDSNLMLEFPNVADQKRIKDAAIAMRAKYDEYIELANNVLTGLGFKPIEKRKNYFMHFQELGDFLSKNGIPFNPQSMKENNLPTDINGLTEFFVPQKKWFASMNQRKGKRTVYDAVTGIDKYISGVADIIYHTEDIQRGRAFEELIRDTYGQGEAANANRSLLPEELQMERLKKQQDAHLSKYVRWVHNWTDNLAGKKNRIDRAIEDFGDRAGFSILDTARKQVSANMIGFNLSSSLTNLIASVQAMAKTNKVAVAKGTADTIRNIVQKDDFISKNSFLTNRFGSDMLSKNLWQKAQDAGFIFMKGMDWFSANQIVRSKFYELRSKGMGEEQAHAEAGKFAARIMGDRTKGANAMFYNSKLFNVVGQFQLEVNNQLYSMFYDTYHESKEKAKGDSIKTAAGITFTLGQLFVMTHIFGQTFKAVAGYNPTFDVIGIIATALGLGDDDDDNVVDNLQEAADQLLDALPYSNLMTGGGRIPLSSAIPDIGGLITGGKDNYGNDLEFSKEMAKLPYLLMPAGYGQIKKTTQGLKMFDKDNPVPGSYTDNGNLRFPVEDTPFNRIQAGLFGQWSNENAREYFDNERQPLKEKQIQEYKDLDIPIADYWKYRDGLKEQKTLEDKFNYIADLDFPVSKKNIMINNIVDREEKVDMTNYDNFSSYEEFDFATKNPEKYSFLESVGVSYKDYKSSEKAKEAYDWAYNNPDKCALAKAAAGDIVTYRNYTAALNDLKADKDSNGKTISGSRKIKVAEYINSLDADYGAKLILYKSEYKSDDQYNYEIIDYLNSRQDISYQEMVEILNTLGFVVDSQGYVRW